MGLYVLKFGGTSVGDIGLFEKAADRVVERYLQGHRVVVVVSAMAGETERLIALAKSIDMRPSDREYSVLVATGELVSMALMTLMLHKLGIPSLSLTGAQAKILTSDSHMNARIKSIDTDLLYGHLENKMVVVIPGFQGVNESGEVTTLGRGGSDTTAVAIAAALEADECQIYTDVDGVFTADPRVVSQASLLSHISFEEMLELASLGAKVLQRRCVELAGRYRVVLRVLSSFREGSGTLITYEGNTMEQPLVSGVAFNRNEAKVTVLGVPDKPGIASEIITPIGHAGIDIDMIIQNVGGETTDFTFTVSRDDYDRTLEILRELIQTLPAQGISGNNKIAKISLVGIGMRSHAGVASTMFKALAKEGINIQMISTSEIKISVVVDEKYVELGVRALHSAFGLEGESIEEFDPVL